MGWKVLGISQFSTCWKTFLVSVIIKKSGHGCFGRPCAQGSTITAFNPLAVQEYVSCRQGFFSSVCQAVVEVTWASMTKVCQQCWKEWTSWYAQEGVPNNAISAPKLADFWVHLFSIGLAWCIIGIYHAAISVLLEPHCHHKAPNHPLISRLMHPFYSSSHHVSALIHVKSNVYYPY